MNRQLTMLIVDDMEVERISFAEIFKDEYQILEAENGKQAMEQLEQQKVHIVLLDLCMPVMDGFEVIREMKQQDKYADIPIVAKTAIDEKTEVKALEAGADEYIFSPCDPAIVKKRVHNLVEKYILEREKIRAPGSWSKRPPRSWLSCPLWRCMSPPMWSAPPRWTPPARSPSRSTTTPGWWRPPGSSI